MNANTASITPFSRFLLQNERAGCSVPACQLDRDDFSQCLQLGTDNDPELEVFEQAESEFGRQPADKSPELGTARHLFLHETQVRLSQMRLELCALSRTQDERKRQVSVAGLAAQCHWLAGCASTAGYVAAAQVGTALEAVCKEVHDTPALMHAGTLRSIASGIDLLIALTTCAPVTAGQAEGARILLLDSQSASRIRTLRALNNFGMAGIGIASTDTVIGLLSHKALDLVIVREDSARETIGLCQAIRAVPRHLKTAVVVRTSHPDWESRTQYVLAGVNEIIDDNCLGCELALKALGHFFRTRLSGLRA